MESIDPGSFCYGVFFCLCVVGVVGAIWYHRPDRNHDRLPPTWKPPK